MRPWLAVAAGSLALLLSCGQTKSRHDSSSGQQPPAGIPEADAARIRAELHCRNVFECCDPTGDHGDVVLAVSRFISEDECVHDYQSYFQSVHDRARALGLIYDPECFDIELAGEEAFGCSVGSSRRWCALGHYHGNVPVDGACRRDLDIGFSDCAKGLYCQTTYDTGVCMVFVPRSDPEYVYVEIGEACGSPVQCKPGAFCHPDSRTCVPTLAAGEPCPPTLTCEASTYCHPESRTCVPRLGAGQACQLSECEAGTHCATWEANVVDRVCTPNLADGEPCTYDQSCQTVWCGEVCAERPPTVCLQAISPQP